jgi:hypothetical protein
MINAGSLTNVELMEALGRIYGFDVVNKPQLERQGPGHGHMHVVMNTRREADPIDVPQLKYEEEGTMPNKLSDLNNILFMQLQRLNDGAKTGERLAEEIRRSGAIANVSRNIIDNARLALDAEKAKGKKDIGSIPTMIGGGSGEKDGADEEI